MTDISNAIMTTSNTTHLSHKLRSDRFLAVSDIRTITSTSQYEPDEKVIKLTVEVSARELIELELAISHHLKHMRRDAWSYADLKNIQRVFNTALDMLRRH